MDRQTPTPNGCRHCGGEARGHFRQWTDAAGWHGWTAPTDAQRLDRMKARRAARLAPAARTAVDPRLVVNLTVHDDATAAFAKVIDSLNQFSEARARGVTAPYTHSF